MTLLCEACPTDAPNEARYVELTGHELHCGLHASKEAVRFIDDEDLESIAMRFESDVDEYRAELEQILRDSIAEVLRDRRCPHNCLLGHCATCSGNEDHHP